ncbi:MAG: tRNA (guanosine(37)-N1)-methyltransferase TrmD [Candidatus Omnitrophota bacterium]
MVIDILTLFPGMFCGVFDESMLKIARDKEIVKINTRDIRDWTFDRHRTADDKPYGGGPGMVMKIEPLDRAVAEIKMEADKNGRSPVVALLTPQGKKFDQSMAKELCREDHIIMVCGHYEGFDERIRTLADIEISIGDYILTCGEIPAMAVCDAVVRLIPGVLGDEECLRDESFEAGLLEYPQYTRPFDYKGSKVPEVLLSGDPKKIAKWREEKALERTTLRRPDLLGEQEQFGKQK